VSTDSGLTSKLASKVSTDENGDERVLIRPGRSPASSACEPFRDFVELSLGKGRNAVAIWQDLVSYHGFEAQYASVKRFVRQSSVHAVPEELDFIGAFSWTAIRNLPLLLDPHANPRKNAPTNCGDDSNISFQRFWGVN